MKKNDVNFRIPVWCCPKQPLRIMKLTGLFFMLALFQVSASVYSQNSNLVQVKATNQSINEVLKSIEDKTNYTFLFNRSNVNVDQRVDIDLETSSIEDALDILLAGTKIRYRSFNNSYVLYTNESDLTAANVQQEVNVKGKVTAAKGAPIPGVTVMIKGTDQGTVSDFDGNYTLTNVPGNATLIFSFVGMKTREVPVNSLSVINVTLEEETIGLEEVIAIGYGKMKKSDLTGAISSVKSEDITRAPSPNPMEGLQGRVAGLDITRSSGQAGEGVTIQLRGTRSFTASGNPTFIIDGMPGDYSTLNPNDIESIEVLKDASSTAVYGSAGANGVILITTKSAKVGKLNVSLNVYTGFNGWSKTPEMRKGDSYVQALRDANKATGNWASAADDAAIFASAEAYQAHLDGDYINWAEELMQTSVTQNYSLAISGGTEKTRTYFSMNYTEENGQYTGDTYRVYSSNVRVDNTIKPWLKVGANMQGAYVDRNRAYAKLENALAAEPLGKIRDEEGKLNVEPVIGSTMINLLLNTQENVYENQDQNFNLYINPYIELKPLKGLTFTFRIGGALNFMRNNYFQGEGSYQYYVSSGPASQGPNANVFAQITQNRSYNYKWENILTYNFKLRNVHDFVLTGVSSWEHNQYDGTWMKETNIEHNKYLWHNMSSGSEYASNATSYNMSKGMGLVGRVNYSYNGKYLLSASMRADGSTRLASGNQWDYFPAASVGWRISDETFMQGTRDWLNSLKFRVGYGVTGTANIAPYSSVSNLDFANMALGGQLQNIYMFSQNYANPDLSWEKSYNTNIGVDANLFNGRVDLTADIYQTNTDGVIWSRRLPIVSGGYNPTSPYQMNINICETRNKGLEFAINSVNIDKRDFRWNSTLTFTYNKEEIISLQDGDSDHINISEENYTLSIGYPVRSFYHYKLDGVWQLDEAADAEVFGAKPGDLKINIPGMVREGEGSYSKEDEDGNIVYYDAENKYTPSGADYQVLGYNSPDWTLGYQSSFTYKNFDLSFFMYMRWGQMIEYAMLGRYDPAGVRNFPEYFNYWTAENPSNDFPAINSSMGITNYVGSAALNYVDGSYFKIKNVTLGYSMPQNLLNRWGIEKFRVYGTITNPLVVAKSHLLKDYDPEMNGEIDYPLTKQLVFGVNLTF